MFVTVPCPGILDACPSVPRQNMQLTPWAIGRSSGFCGCVTPTLQGKVDFSQNRIPKMSVSSWFPLRNTKSTSKTGNFLVRSSRFLPPQPVAPSLPASPKPGDRVRPADWERKPHKPQADVKTCHKPTQPNPTQPTQPTSQPTSQPANQPTPCLFLSTTSPILGPPKKRLHRLPADQPTDRPIPTDTDRQSNLYT